MKQNLLNDYLVAGNTTNSSQSIDQSQAESESQSEFQPESTAQSEQGEADNITSEESQAAINSAPVVLGKFGKSHGLKGWQYFDCYCEDSASIMNYSNLKALPAQDSNSISTSTAMDVYRRAPSVELTAISAMGKRFITHIKGVSTPEETIKWCNCLVAVERSQLPPPQKGNYYWHDLVGARVISLYMGREILLGTINSMQRVGDKDNMVIKSSTGKWHYVPFVQPDFVTDILISPDASSSVPAIPTIKVSWDPDF